MTRRGHRRITRRQRSQRRQFEGPLAICALRDPSDGDVPGSSPAVATDRDDERADTA